ncbi:outer membrane porin OpcP [Pandoraea aquatica]|uniref:Outer membrane porin OpcP n=1 Tax=Pandoraea aquatica TaxID=2508290 RepID=A0A5E4Z4X1_9BURK|nr:porin [Pandoraea aquatica]VVE56176.1 outer membrane porin OpcP [Pandoraea aquatica]
MKAVAFGGAALALCSIVSQAHGASGSGVTLYGVMDAGLTYVSNSGGSHNLKFDDGIQSPNMLGIRGVEELGGGTHVEFDLVNQFAVGTGAIQPPTKGIFGRNAWIGISNERFGTVRFGNQYDFMIDALFFGRTDAALTVGGIYNFRAGPFQKIALPYNPPYASQFDWDRMSGQSVSNSVKYQSPSFAGLSFGALYGIGGVPGALGSGNTVSAGLNYESGSFGMGAAYTEVKYLQAGMPQVGIRNWGVGMRYDFGSLGVNALITTVRNTANGGAIAQGQIGLAYTLTPQWRTGIDYMYMKGNGYLDNNHAHQISALLAYSFSKRTMVYTEMVYQRTNANAQALVSGVIEPNGTSSGPSQMLTRVGVLTRF